MDDATTNIWTAHLVGERLTGAFRDLPATPIYSPRTDTLLTLGGLENTALDLITLTARYLGGRTSLRRRKLLAWARASAGGPAVRELCREFGWSRSSFERVRRAALEEVAAGLRRDKIPID